MRGIQRSSREIEDSTALNGSRVSVLARDNWDLIMFLYFLVSSCLQFALIGLGFMYVMQKGRQQRDKENKDEQLRHRKYRRDEDLRFKHEHSNQRMPEWRKFSKAVNILVEYMILKRTKTLRRLQQVAKSFTEIRILAHINGLEVLRYMINEEESFHSTELDQLRLDLEPVLVLLNQCWSLCLLSGIPRHVKEEVRRIFIELGSLALLFISEQSRRSIIKRCLRDFDCYNQHESLSGEQLEKEIPYVKYIQFGHGEQCYATCDNFTYNLDPFNPRVPQFLGELHLNLIHGKKSAEYALSFAKKMQKTKTDWINEDATDEEMVLKLMHDVRCHVWKKSLGENVQLEIGVADTNQLQAVYNSEKQELSLVHQLIRGLFRITGRYNFLYLVAKGLKTFYDSRTLVLQRER